MTTDPSGAFQFPSIPIGPFRLVAKEPSLGLTGSATGELTPGNSPLRVDFPVQGLGFAEITVLEPDGVTAATNATVTLRTSPPFTSDTDDSGRANFPEIHLGRFQVFAASNRNGERNSVALGELNLTRPGQSQQVILRLSGVARLNGSVVDASGRPVANAAVGFEADFGRTGAERRRTLTDANGLFALNDLPLGPWRIQATHDALAAFDGGEFTEAGESRQADLRLGPSGSVTGTVLRENGIELHEVEVAVFFASQNGQPGFARAITDFAGTFVANGIPVGVPFRIQIDLPSLDGRFALTTNLTTHGQILDVGNLRLDQTPPAITSIQPADGAIEVEPSPRIVVDFSESLLPGSLRSDGIRLSQGTNATAIRFHATNGPAGPDSRLIIAPESNLRSARGYTLLVAGADQIDAAGRPILIGPTDRQGRPLPGTVTSRFTVRDFEPPVVVNEFPTNNATGVEPEVAIRWELDEPIQTNRLQVIVRGPGGSLPGTTGVNASQRILAWVPERRLNPDTTYEVEIRGLVDFSNNEAPPRTNRFSTLDTQGPRIAQLRLAPGQRPVANATVTLEAILDPPEPGAVVRFIRNGSDLGIATEGPVFRWPVRLPAQGTVRISALALDIAGNPGEAAVLELAVGPNQRPIVTLARIEPPFGPLETGRRFSFSANPSDDASLAALRITALGALELTREIFSPSNGVPTPLVFELPPDFVANGDIEFRVVALDDSGATSETAILRYATTDATPPTLELEAPIDGSVLDPRQPLGFGLHVRDNSPFVAATILLSGSVTSTNRLELDLQPNVVLHAPLNLSLSNGLAGGKIECLVRIEDRAGNQVELHRAYTLRGVVGPRLRNIFAVDLGSGWILPGPERLSPWVSSVTFTFDRALAVHPAQTNLLQVTNSLGADIPVIRRVSANGASVEWNAAPLPPGATVSIRLLPGLVDANGNAIQLSDGSDFPASGLESTFRVASFGGLDVTNGRPVVPGQTFLAHIDHETPFPPWNLRLNDVAQPRVVLTATNRFQVTIPTNASIARLSAWSSAPGRPAIELRDVELALRSRDDDDDRDGLPNGWEADRSWVQGAPRFNPFDDTDAAADWDFDQLDNRGEFERGTDPFIADSDGDGLRDGLESHPGSCPDPLKFDSDGDGIRDGDDLAPCAAGEALTLNPQVVSVPEGGHETNLITVTGIGLTPVAIDFSRELPRPSFVEFADFGIRGTNPVTRQVVFRPSFTDAGEHRLVFAITGRRASTVVTTNLELRLIVEDRDNTRFTRWARAASGNWSQPTNWTAGVPGVGTNAVIDLPGSYTVSLDTEAFVESLELGAASGTQTLQLTSRALTLNSASVVRSNAVVRLAGSSRLRGQAEITADGLIAVENGTLEGAGLLRIARDGHLEFGSATTPSFPLLSLPIENSGVVRISPRATLGLSGIQATNRPQGLWHLDDGAMRWNTGSPRFVNEGAWIKTGTNVSTVYFIDIEQRGLLRADDGGIAIESSPVHFAAGGTNSGTGMLRLSSTRGDIAGPLDFARGIVLINSTLTNHATQAWPDLTMTGGVLAGAGEISVSRSWSAQGGSLLGDGRFRIAESAEGMISSSLVIGRPFELAGRARLQTNTLVYVDHHEIQNLGTLEIPDAASLRWFTAFGAGTIENRGTLLKAGTGSLGFAGVSLRNLGRIDVQGGVLDIDYSSENHGRIDVASGTRVDIGAGMIHGGTSWIGGDGQVIFSFGTNDVRGELQPRGGFTVGGGQITIRNSFDRPVNVTLTGGRLSLESPQEFRALHVGNGELTGSGGGVLVNEAFEWTAGTLASAAPIVLNTNSQSRIRGGTLSARLENLGRIEVAPNASVRFLGGDLINRGELELVGLTTFSSQSGTSNRLVNEGLFRTGTNDVNFFGVPLELRGTNVLSAVTLQFGTGTNESRLSIPAGGRLRFQDGFTHTPESRLEGDGAIEFNNGRHEILGGFAPRGDLLFAAGTIRIAPSFTHPARFTLRNATVSLQGDAALREVSLESGRIEVATRLTASRSFTWTGGTLDGSGTVRTDPTTSVRIQGFNDKRLGATFEAEGDVAFAENSRLLLTGGTWRIPAEATHDVLGASQIWPASGIPNSRVQILGTLRKAGPGTLDIDASLDLQGSLLIESGQVDLGGNSRLAGLTRLDPATELRLGGTTNLWSANVRFEGTGALSFYGSRSVLVLETPADLGSLAVTFQNGTQIQGEFPLRSGTAGSLMFQSGTFEIQGAVDVQGRMTVALGSIVRIDDALNLAASGTLDNLGRRDGQNRANIRTRAFQNFGGTDLGVPPDVVPGPSPLGIRPSPGSTPPSQPRLTATPSTTEEGPPTAWILTWDPGDAGFDAIEFSDDLATWQRLEIDPATRARGSLVIPASASRSGPGTLFFRHRNTEW
ncbi:MAG: Ig-like domain-containing protein [Limisphaerales bacterium]